MSEVSDGIRNSTYAWAELMEFVTGVRIRIALCTCCAEPRPMLYFGADGDTEWMHADTETYAEHRHIHVSSSARDCDGLYDHGHTYRIPSIRHEALRPLHLRNTPDYGPDFNDLWTYMVRHEAPLYRDCEVKVEGRRMTWHARTDEGWEGGELWVCEDIYCAFEGSEFRDHTAEAAGY